MQMLAGDLNVILTMILHLEKLLHLRPGPCLADTSWKFFRLETKLNSSCFFFEGSFLSVNLDHICFLNQSHDSFETEHTS